MTRSSTLDHVAGQREGRTAEADDRQPGAEVFHHQGDRLGHIAQFGCAIGAQYLYIVGGADRLFDHRPFAGGEMEGQAHDFERQQQVGEDDGSVNLEELGGGDGHFGRELRLLADFDQGMVLADVAILLHVAACLAHEPDRSGFDRKPLAGAHKEGIGSGHKQLS